ncbi:type II toxin-antitoxin system VapC family toxin [Ellagibacter isourolithinifaciens]|uniref:type II toxin-antitoxin system VapC family toxin n=1 Tax=Ellagibacter isourolithinifaciens TaxID=2137581 RepID=UPI003AB0941E
MSKFFFDTNVLLDLVIPARPQHGFAAELFREIAARVDGRALLLASSLKDVYYIFNRHYGDEQTARKVISQMRASFEVVELTLCVVDDALCSNEPDYEDALVRAAAENVRCDYIVSRDEKAFRASCCKRVDARQALALLAES